MAAVAVAGVAALRAQVEFGQAEGLGEDTPVLFGDPQAGVGVGVPVAPPGPGDQAGLGGDDAGAVLGEVGRGAEVQVDSVTGLAAGDVREGLWVEGQVGDRAEDRADAQLAAGCEDLLGEAGRQPGGAQQPAVGDRGQRPDREGLGLGLVVFGEDAFEERAGQAVQLDGSRARTGCGSRVRRAGGARRSLASGQAPALVRTGAMAAWPRSRLGTTRAPRGSRTIGHR